MPVALIVLNLGLYTRLASQPRKDLVTFPYHEDFSAVTTVPYEEFGGDWEIRDQALVQMSTSGYDLSTFIPVSIPADQAYQFEASLKFLGGAMGGGVFFNAQQTTSRQKSHMARFNVDGGKLWLIYGYFGDDSNFTGQGSAALSLDPSDPNPHRLGVRVAGGTYALTLDGAVLAENIPLQYEGGAVGFISATSQVAFDDVAVDPYEGAPQAAPTTAAPDAAPTTTPASETVVSQPLYQDTFDNPAASDSLWRPISGNWQPDNGSLVQTQAEGYDLSAIYQKPLTGAFTLRTTFLHRQGVGGGVLVNLPAPDNKIGGTMVRYVDKGDYISWGYFDADGNYQAQGGSTVPLPGTAVHILEVTVNGSTYGVRLDGNTLGADIPLQTPNATSYVALTASQSIVQFDDVQMLSDQSIPAVPTPAGLTQINAETVSGTWVAQDNLITQTDTQLTDYVAGTGLAAERFKLTVDIKLPAGSADAGAGMIFHMQGRDDVRLGQMIRLANGGKGIFWGHYDEAGTFQGEGSADLTLSPGDTHTFVITVHAETYEIQVDGQTIAAAVPVQRQAGWIGLLSFSGPVEFSNIRLELGE